MAPKSKPTLAMLTLGLLGVVVAVAARQPLMGLLSSKPTPPAAPEIKQPPLPEMVAKPHLGWAEQECDRIIDEHVKAIDTFFADAKQHTPAFADEALSWGSKWRLVVDHVPFTSGERHETFIRERFEEYVFQPSDLEDAVKQVVASYLKHVESIEGQMLVRIRTDVADFPEAYLIARIDEEKLHASYDEAVSRVMEATGSNLRADIATELVSIISGEVLAQVAVRLGVSAGILGTGAASSWATFGVGLVVGLIVDQIVSRVWDWYADPKGNLAAELDAKLDEINKLLVDGSDDTEGLRARLRAFAKERAAVRSQAVLTLLQSQ
ncbi:MAG: hypothetical protein WD648_02055 [Planctomycetaceae bacterium]